MTIFPQTNLRDIEGMFIVGVVIIIIIFLLLLPAANVHIKDLIQEFSNGEVTSILSDSNLAQKC